MNANFHTYPSIPRLQDVLTLYRHWRKPWSYDLTALCSGNFWHCQLCKNQVSEGLRIDEEMYHKCFRNCQFPERHDTKNNPWRFSIGQFSMTFLQNKTGEGRGRAGQSKLIKTIRPQPHPGHQNVLLWPVQENQNLGRKQKRWGSGWHF